MLILENFLQYWHIILLFFTVAVLYSSVGFGGGSSYLAILALTGIVFTQIRATALLCNIVVVSGNVYLFIHQKKVNFKKIMPLILFSIPLAFLGGTVKINQQFFFILLGFTLLFAAITMWLSKQIVTFNEKNSDTKSIRNASFGGIIGFISGMVGIGGGIFLSPILLLIKADSSKNIATAASLFILINSISGLTGQFTKASIINEIYSYWPLFLLVLLGGQLGNYLNLKIFPARMLALVTSALVIFVAIRMGLKLFA